MAIVEIFIVRLHRVEGGERGAAGDHGLSEWVVVSNELVDRKLSFAGSNLPGPQLNRSLPACSLRTPRQPVCPRRRRAPLTGLLSSLPGTDASLPGNSRDSGRIPRGFPNLPAQKTFRYPAETAPGCRGW